MPKEKRLRGEDVTVPEPKSLHPALHREGVLRTIGGHLVGTMPRWSALLEEGSTEDSARNHHGLTVYFCVAKRFRILHIVDFIDYTLRGVAQVAFANNSLSGIFILLGLYYTSIWTATCGVIGIVSSTLMGLLVGQKGAVRAGLFGYNGLLVGLAIATFTNPPWYWFVGLISAFGGAASSFVAVVLGRVFRRELPGLTLAFNIVTFIILSALPQVAFVPLNGDLWRPALPVQDLETGSWIIMDFGAGLIRGVGQIFFAGETISGLLIFFGLVVCSPLTAAMTLAGSIISSCIAIGLGVPHATVNAGLAGYNGALTLPAIAGVFLLPQWRSFIVGTCCTVASVFIWLSLKTVFSPISVPALTFPFCIITLALLLMGGWEASVGLVTIPLRDVATPEQHLFRFWKLAKAVRSWRKHSKYLRQTTKPRNKKTIQMVPLTSMTSLVPLTQPADDEESDREVVYDMGGREDNDDEEAIRASIRYAGDDDL